MTNRRTDQWGGGPEQRVRFVVEALKRIRERVGDSIALGIRVGGQEFRQGGYDNMELREMLYCIGETGLLDFVDIDTGHCWGAPSYVPSSYHPHAEFREVGKAARADLDPKIKVLFTGRINDPVLAEELIRNGYCDLVGMGVLPLQFRPGDNPQALGLDGSERIDITGLDDGRARHATVTAHRHDGTSLVFQADVLLLTPKEVEYFRHGGLLQYVLRQLAARHVG